VDGAPEASEERAATGNTCGGDGWPPYVGRCTGTSAGVPHLGQGGPTPAWQPANYWPRKCPL